MLVMNRARTEALRAYESNRLYRIEYRGLPKSLAAEMAVHLTFRFPDSKQFTIVSESGSKLLLDRVLHRLIASENEAGNEENRARTALTPDNYSFHFLRADSASGDYVMEVRAKTKNKYLYNGTIWVDPKDYAVTRIEAEPAKNPSFWIKKTQITHTYGKLSEFWLPLHNQSVSNIRLGGRAVLTIDYRDYKITEATPLHANPAEAKP